MADKTIKELAEEIGVSKQAIWQKIKKKSSTDLRQFTSTKGNTVYVSDDGQKVIKSMFKNNSSTKTSTDNINQNVNVDDNELTFLRGLVHDLQSEKKELHRLLDQQQQLTLQANKQIERLEAQERLTAASEEPTDKESSTKQTAPKPPEKADKPPYFYFDPESIKSDTSTHSTKKWWHFFRKES